MKKILNWLILSFKKGIWLPMTVFIAHIIAILVFNVYYHFPSFDIFMHFFGGVAISYFYFHLIDLGNENILGKLNRFSFILFIFLLTASTTVFWEFAEWSVDYLFKFKTQVSIDDTMLDMFLGMFGSVLLISIKYKEISKIIESNIKDQKIS